MSGRPFGGEPSAADRARYADAVVAPYWLDALPARALAPALEGATETDLCIVGGGFTGLWAALHAKRDDPAREVVLLEAETVAFGASGRNGGFLEASLTHGLANGEARFADELPVLERLARENHAGLVADLAAHGIDCAYEGNGTLAVALEPHELAWLEEAAVLARAFGYEAELLDAAAVRAQVDSPTYLGALWTRSGSALVDPARLARGLVDAAVRAGVRVYERTPATGMSELRSHAVEVHTPAGRVRARRVLLATSAYPPLLKRIGAYVAPVYDYVLVTEPLRQRQRAALNWGNRQGVSDLGNQFHYYRLTPDDRILFGGYDAVYRRGGPVGADHDDHDPTFGGSHTTSRRPSRN